MTAASYPQSSFPRKLGKREGKIVETAIAGATAAAEAYTDAEVSAVAALIPTDVVTTPGGNAIAADGTVGQVLTTDGAGVWTFETPVAPPAPLFDIVYGAQALTVGGAAQEIISVPGVLNTDLVFVTLTMQGTAAVIVGAATGTDQIAVNFSVDPGVSAINYMVVRAAV